VPRSVINLRSTNSILNRVLGYWVPWQAARELAATFCWHIRWALTPVFGNDFPQMCIAPHDRAFARFVVHPDTVRFCATETDRFRDEGISYQLLQPKPASAIATSQVPIFTPPAWNRDDPASPPESGYGTDIDHYKTELSGLVSPHTQYNTRHLASVDENKSPIMSSTVRPLTPFSPIAACNPTSMSMSTSIPGTVDSEGLHTKRMLSAIVYDGSDCAVVSVHTRSDERKNSREDASQSRGPPISKTEAAEILLSINVVARDSKALPEPKRTRRGYMY